MEYRLGKIYTLLEVDIIVINYGNLPEMPLAALTGKTSLLSKSTRILPQEMGTVAGNTEVTYIYLVAVDYHQMST